MKYRCVLSDSEGTFFKPDEIKFDPHMHVGLFLFEDNESIRNMIANSRKLFCKCIDEEGCYIRRMLHVNSVSFRSNIVTFTYSNLEIDISSFPFLHDLKDLPEEISIVEILRAVEKSIYQDLRISFSQFIHKLKIKNVYPIILLASIYIDLYENHEKVDVLELCFLLKEIIYSSS